MTTTELTETAEPTAEIACALPENEQVTRRAEMRETLATWILESRELKDGLALRFAREHEAGVAAFVEFERGCCGFANYETISDDSAGMLWLEITGPDGTKDFLLRWIGEALPKDVPKHRRSLRLGTGGLLAAVTALVLCETATLAVLLGAVGLAGAVGAVTFWTDAVALPLLVASAAWIGWVLLRRRSRARAAA